MLMAFQLGENNRIAGPAKAMQATAAHSPGARPASANACTAASITAAKLSSTPKRMFAGPASPSPRIAPEKSHSRARHRVPPPSTPRRKGSFSTYKLRFQSLFKV